MNVFLFAGQSSKFRTMFSWLEEHHPAELRATAAIASALVGDAWRPDPEAEVPFPTNRAVQLAVFVANHVHLQILRNAGIEARYSAGLSLGEYNHLVHIGALSFEDALELVDARGRAYDDGPRGCMAAVFPIDHEELVPLIEELAKDHLISISNYNSPQQFVVAGSANGVSELVERVERDTFAEARIIERDVPMHCELFRPAARRLRQALQAASFTAPTRPYVPNVAPALTKDATPEFFVEHLARHVYEPVRFRETVDLFMAEVADPVFIEVGPRHVITDLLHRRWCRHPKFSTHNQEALTQLIESPHD